MQSKRIKNSICSIVLFLILLNSACASTGNRNYDSSRYFIKINNDLLTNPAFTGFNNLYSRTESFGCYTPDIPVENGWSKPKEYINSAEFSFGKRISFSLGLTNRFKDEAAILSKEINVSFSISRQTLNLGNFRIGFSGSSLNYGNDFLKFRFGDQINPKLGFIYSTNEILPVNGFSKFDLLRYHAGFFYSYKNLFYIGYSMLDINEPVISLYKNDDSKLHSKSIVTAGGMADINKDFDVCINLLIQYTKYYEITQVQPSVCLGYKSKYYFGGGINLINANLTTYYFQLNANVFKCVTIAFKYELLSKSYFSNSLSPAYWGIGTTFYIDRFIKQKK